MTGKRWKHRPKSSFGKPPKDGVNKYVLTREDAENHRYEIVAVRGYPVVLGTYAMPFVVGASVSELKENLRVIRMKNLIDLVVHVEPAKKITPTGDEEWQVRCYVNVLRKEPEIIRKEGVS